VKTAIGMVGTFVVSSVVKASTEAFNRGRDRAVSGDVDFNMLYLCIFIDIIGDTSYLFPGVGEGEDLLWAPLSALAVSTIFKSRAVGTIDFAKEILPFSDLLPVATLSWVLKYLYPDSSLAKLLGLSNATKTDSEVECTEK